MSMAGQVYAHAGQPLERTDYDLVVVGAGRLGLGCASSLRCLLPESSLLIVERGGIPHEEGASVNAPGVWSRARLPEAWRARAEWVRRVWLDPQAETGTVRPHDPAFVASGWLWLGREDEDAPELPDIPDTDAPDLSAFPPQLAELLDLNALPRRRYDALGGYGSAASLALSYGYGAVRLGADLLLNTKASLTPGGLTLRRLTVTRTHQVVVAETRRVRAGQVVVAAGAEGPGLLEEGLGLTLPHRRAWVQTPRLELPAAPGMPVLAAAGLTLRPRDGVYSLLPPTLDPDPHGYTPQGGRLAGVPVGLRRELLEVLLPALDVWPALSGGRLNLGKSVGDVPGYWEARPRGGWPLWQRLDEGHSLLLGGPHADTVGLSVAYDLAATLAGEQGRPWA